MKVLWRQKEREWEIANSRRYDDEAHLQNLLAENPTLIPFDDVSDQLLAPRIMISELGLPGSGSSDLVGINEYGGITIIECKLAANPEIKRKVVGQVLEYAAYLWRQPYSHLDVACQKRRGKTLAEAVRDSLDDEAKNGFDEASFVDSVTENLNTGDFQLVIAVDTMRDELRNIIEYLSQGPSSLSLFALEIRYFASADSEILVPQLTGYAPKKPGQRRGSGTTWTPERFFEDVRSRELGADEVEILKKLLDFAKAESSKVNWGSGQERGSFTFYHDKHGVTYSMFSAYSDGKLMLSIGYIKDRVDRQELSRFIDSLRRIPGFASMKVSENYNSWPTVRVADAFSSDGSITAFQETILDFRDAIDRTS